MLILLVALFCAIAADCADIKTMACKGDTCKAFGLPGQTVNVGHVFDCRLTETTPAEDSSCNPNEGLCVKRRETKYFDVEGPIPPGEMPDRFVLTVNTAKLTLMLKVDNAPEPDCPADVDCPEPHFAEVKGRYVKDTKLYIPLETTAERAFGQAFKGTQEIAGVFNNIVTGRCPSPRTKVCLTSLSGVYYPRIIRIDGTLPTALPQTITGESCGKHAFIFERLSLGDCETINTMACTGKECTMTALAGQRICYQHAFSNVITTFTPDSNPCDSKDSLCVSRRATNSVTLKGNIPADKAVPDGFIFTEGEKTASTMVKLGEGPAPVCPAGVLCTAPHYIEVNEKSLVTTTLFLPFGTYAATVSGKAIKGAMEITDVIVLEKVCTEATNVCLSETSVAHDRLIQVEGILADTLPITINTHDGEYKFTFIREVLESCSPIDFMVCKDKICSATMRPGEVVCYQHAFANPITAFTPNETPCEPKNEMCVTKHATKSVKLSGNVPASKSVPDRFVFTENANSATTMVKRDNEAVPECPIGVLCTAPHFIQINSKTIVEETLILPFDTSSATVMGSAWKGTGEVVNVVKPAGSCSEAHEVCISATSVAPDRIIKMQGKLGNALPITVDVTAVDTFTFTFNRVGKHAFPAITLFFIAFLRNAFY